jgi:hypothetical protein
MFDRLTDLATCLCRQITENGGPETCFCGVIPGDAAIQDYAGDCATGCGMAWVRLVSMMPMSGVDLQNTDPGNCSSEVGAIVEVGIMRCIGSGDQRRTAPKDAELLRATEQQIKDALTMRQAIACCPSIDSKDFILGAYAPMGPMGGLVGGAWSLTVI